MDNRVNENRRKISALRSEMSRVEAQMRAEIAGEQDCSSTASRLMALRSEVAELARQRKQLGDEAPVGTQDVRKPRFAKA
jgi:predicted RNase H-like nuclease (RuvC/YqgF family)